VGLPANPAQTKAEQALHTISKYPKPARCWQKDRGEPMAFYDSLAQRWQSIRHDPTFTERFREMYAYSVLPELVYNKALICRN